MRPYKYVLPALNSLDAFALAASICIIRRLHPNFERELALLVALQGESIWKGGGGHR